VENHAWGEKKRKLKYMRRSKTTAQLGLPLKNPWADQKPTRVQGHVKTAPSLGALTRWEKNSGVEKKETLVRGRGRHPAKDPELGVSWPGGGGGGELIYFFSCPLVKEKGPTRKLPGKKKNQTILIGRAAQGPKTDKKAVAKRPSVQSLPYPSQIKVLYRRLQKKV